MSCPVSTETELKFKQMEYEAQADSENPEQYKNKDYKVETKYVVKDKDVPPTYENLYTSKEECSDEKGLPLPVTAERRKRTSKWSAVGYVLILLTLAFLMFNHVNYLSGPPSPLHKELAMENEGEKPSHHRYRMKGCHGKGKGKGKKEHHRKIEYKGKPSQVEVVTVDN